MVSSWPWCSVSLEIGSIVCTAWHLPFIVELLMLNKRNILSQIMSTKVFLNHDAKTVLKRTTTPRQQHCVKWYFLNFCRRKKREKSIKNTQKTHSQTISKNTKQLLVLEDYILRTVSCPNYRTFFLRKVLSLDAHIFLLPSYRAKIITKKKIIIQS